MKKYNTTYLCLFSLILISITYACGLNNIETSEGDYIYNLELIPRLGSTLDGYFVLKLDSTKTQTIHRISGRLLKNGEEPYPPEKVEWDSNLTWALNDTTYIIYRSFLNLLGNWVVVDTSYISGFDGEIVPTINESSYTGTDGEINTIIAPIYSMKGDTMIVRCRFKEFESKLYIILR